MKGRSEGTISRRPEPSILLKNLFYQKRYLQGSEFKNYAASTRKPLYELIQKVKAFLVSNFHQYNSKLPYIITVVVALVFVIGGIHVFIELTGGLKDELLPQYDQAITDYVISFRTPALTKYFIFITNIGYLYGYLIVLAISAFISYFF